MSYYLTLSSDIQKGEFPDNSPSEFRARLPENKLWDVCEDAEWDIGLSGVSLPSLTDVHPEGLILHSSITYHPDNWSTHGLVCVYTFQSSGKSSSASALHRGFVTLDMIGPSATGVEFIKKLVDKVEQMIRYNLPVGESLYTDQVVDSVTVKRRRAPKFKWDGDDLILDNSETWRGLKWKYFGFLAELGMNMGWIVYKGSLIDYNRGENMLIELLGEKDTKPNIATESFYDGGEQDFPDTSGGADYFATNPFEAVSLRPPLGGEGSFLIFSDHYNWRFVRLNEAFDKFRTEAALRTVERPLYVFIDLIETQWVDGAYNELLRTVPYKKGETWWEPRHVQYHEHRGQGIEVCRVRVSELNGKAVSFDRGVTRVCLHFKRRRRRRHGTSGSHQRCLE